MITQVNDFCIGIKINRSLAERLVLSAALLGVADRGLNGISDRYPCITLLGKTPRTLRDVKSTQRTTGLMQSIHQPGKDLQYKAREATHSLPESEIANH